MDNSLTERCPAFRYNLIRVFELLSLVKLVVSLQPVPESAKSIGTRSTSQEYQACRDNASRSGWKQSPTAISRAHGCRHAPVFVYTCEMGACFSNLTASEAFQAAAAFTVLGLCVLGSGYLAMLASLPFSPGSQRERTLWSTALGVPTAVAISVWGQRVLPRVSVNGCFAALAILALVCLILRNRPQTRPRFRLAPTDRRAMILGLLLIAFALYCVLETIDLQFGRRLYLSTLVTDWSVRAAMVGGAMRSSVPPLNGLSTLSTKGIGFAPHLRYYYFWYVLIAQVATLLQLRAQPVLTASCIWAGWGFLASCFLALKYLLGLRQRWPQACLALLALFCVLGLDILPTAAMWLSHSYHPLLEMEWWRTDRTPSFLGMVLASPHHIAGICSLLSGTLLLFLLNRKAVPSAQPVSTIQFCCCTSTAGLFFAAAAGLSLFPTLCFAFGLSFWAIDLARRRDWRTLISLAGAGFIALLLAHGYLAELSAGSSAAKGFLGLAWRSDSFAGVETSRFLNIGSHSPFVNFLLRQPAVALLDFAELGFYIFVLAAAIRQDLLRPGRLSPGRCLWWALLFGAAVPAYFLSSVATSGPNDLGFDAGFLFRLGLQLWAVDWLRALWSRRAEPRTRWQQAGVASAFLLAFLGVSAQLYQALSIRLYFAVVGSGLAGKQMDILTRDRLSERLYNIYAALRQFDREVTPSRPDTEAIQFNPIGPLVVPEVYFNTHQVASWDTGCGTSFGGDYSHCAPIYRSLLFLYGNTERGVGRSRAQNTLQDGAADRVATSTDLATICHNLKLRAVVADATDSIWSQPNSWVWTAAPLVANATVRVIGCPAGSWRP